MKMSAPASIAACARSTCSGLGGRHVLDAPVRADDDEVDLRPQALYVLLHNVLKERRRARGRLRGPGPVVVGHAHVGEDAYLRPSHVEDHRLAGLREVHAGPGVGDTSVVEVPHRLVQPRGPGVQDVVVAQGDAVYAGLIQHRHQPEVAREGRRVGVVDGISYYGVLEVGEREVSAGEVLPDRAGTPGALGGELVDDPRLRVGALLWHPARDGRVTPIEREVYPHSPPDDHVVLPAVEHDVTAHDHAPQLLGVGNRPAFRLQGIVFRAVGVGVEERLAVHGERLDPRSHLVPGYEPERPRCRRSHGRSRPPRNRSSRTPSGRRARRPPRATLARRPVAAPPRGLACSRPPGSS